MTLSIALLVFVTLQRLGELVLARRNTQRLLARGAYEIGAAHYPLLVLLHGSWLASLWWSARLLEPNLMLVAVFTALQATRLWVLATLGDRWTTRIIILPGAPLITDGPYRFLRHPNYVVVIAEIAILPLAYGLVTQAVVFSLLNAGVLALRIRVEGTALRPR